MFRWLFALLLLSGVAVAGTIGVNFTSPGVQNNPSMWNLGYLFTANQNVSVTALGTYDYNQDGFSQDQQVGLWTSSGVLIASTYVSNSDPLTGFWRFHNITPVNLVSGQSYVVGSQGGEGYTWFTNGMAVAPQITFNRDAFYYIGDLSNSPLYFPTQTDGFGQGLGGGFFGGNVMLSSATPEPGTLALAGPAFLVLAGLARRKFGL